MLFGAKMVLCALAGLSASLRSAAHKTIIYYLSLEFFEFFYVHK
jgi:hypothetical protein